MNPTILSRSELAKRVEDDNAFVKRVLAQPKALVIGAEEDLGLLGVNDDESGESLASAAP